jgi:hypothetical protein
MSRSDYRPVESKAVAAIKAGRKAEGEIEWLRIRMFLFETR